MDRIAMDDVSNATELAEIRARLIKLESSQVGAFGRSVVWFAAFIIVSVVVIVVAAIWTTRSNGSRRMAYPTTTADQVEGRCETEGYRISASAPEQSIRLPEYVQACMRSNGYKFLPTQEFCAAANTENRTLLPSCYVRDPVAWPKAK
jgi:hypothetical protein